MKYIAFDELKNMHFVFKVDEKGVQKNYKITFWCEENSNQVMI